MEAQDLIVIGALAVVGYLVFLKPQATPTTTNQGNTTNAGNAAGTGSNTPYVLNTTPAATCIPMGPFTYMDPSKPGHVYMNPECLG